MDQVSSALGSDVATGPPKAFWPVWALGGAALYWGCWAGRAYIYGLGAMGEAGVSEALRVIHKELDTSMALCGRTDITGVDRDILMIPKGFSGVWEG